MDMYKTFFLSCLKNLLHERHKGVIAVTYRKRMFLLILLDSLIVSTAIFVAQWIVLPGSNGMNIPIFVWSSITLLISHHIFAFIYKLYNKVWAYASVRELLSIAKAVTLSILVTGVVQFLINDFVIYRRALFVTWMMHILLIGGSRFVWRMYRDRYIIDQSKQKRTLIVGAGDAGAMIARQLKTSTNESELFPIGFIDDDPLKQHMHVYNLPVLGTVADIEELVKEHKVVHIVIAIPSLRNGELKKIVEACTIKNIQVQMIPKLEDLMTGKVSVSSLKNVEVEDLLGREPVNLDIEAISEYVTGETILVTGAGGSIGSELCRQLVRFNPAEIILVGHGEYSIYNIHMELTNNPVGETVFTPVIGDVKDRDRMFEIVDTYKPKVMYHAAAHKHVPLMEYNPHEAVKNNALGTRNVAEAADYAGVDTFVLVSTDKAVNPTNVMGSTKRIAEMVIQHISKHSDTTFTAVRFGNVLGSRGSVIPLFRKQLNAGGPLTVTDPEMTRYFMTIPEASRLVIQAGTLAQGGEVFVLDMGEPVKIVDLAKNLIRLSGYNEEDIEIQFTGIRPGEKMYEELLGEDEVLPGEVFEKIYKGRTPDVNFEVVDELINHFLQMEQKELSELLIDMANFRLEELEVFSYVE